MSEHDELVEKVARAIYEARPRRNLYYTPPIPWDDAGNEERHARRDEAKAAIAAMGDGWPSISPELIDKLNKLATYLTEQGEYEACDLIDTVVERLTPPPGAKPLA